MKASNVVKRQNSVTFEKSELPKRVSDTEAQMASSECCGTCWKRQSAKHVNHKGKLASDLQTRNVRIVSLVLILSLTRAIFSEDNKISHLMINFK